MKNSGKRQFSYYMRALHRDVGFFVVGLVLVYAVSGIVLLYRDAGFLVREVTVEKKLSAGLDSDGLAEALHLRGFKVSKIEGDAVYFRQGTYDKSTGIAEYSVRRLPSFLQKLVDLHKTMSGRTNHWFALVFGILLCFLAISSFWMYQKNTTVFRRGICIAAAGIVLTAIILFL